MADETKNSDDTNNSYDDDEAWAIFKYLQITEHCNNVNNDFKEDDFNDDL